MLSSIFFFLLFHQPRGDDEVETRFLHFVRSFDKSVAVLVSKLYAVRSSLILSIQFLRCLPLLRTPSTWQYMALNGRLQSSILVTRPNHFSLRCLIFSTIVSFCCNFSRTISFRILSRLIILNILLSHPIPAVNSLRSSFFRITL